MIIGSLQSGGVEICKISMPEKHSEIRYGQYLDFAMAANDINAWLVKQIEEKRDYGNQYRLKLAKATALIYNVKPEHLLKLEYDGVEFLEKAFSIITELIGTFTPSEIGGKFEHNGKEYFIPEITQALFKGTNNLPPMSFQQLVEISEAERILDDQIKKIDADQIDEKEINGHIVNKAIRKAQSTFQNTMKKIVLCITPHKEIPTDNSFDRWMETKMLELKDISMDNALNVIFFLGGIPNNSGTLIALGSILNICESLNIEMNHPNNTQNELLKSMIEQSGSEL